MGDELKLEDDCSIDYYEVLGVQKWSSRTEIYMAFRKLTVMPPNSECNSDDAANAEKIELLKRAKEVLTSTRLKKAYDTKRAIMMISSLSARSGGRSGCNTTSFNESLDSCSDASQGQRSDSDLSSYYTSADSGGKSSEKYQLAESESEWTSSMRFYREGYFIDHISHDVEQEAPTVNRMKTEKNESKSKLELIKDIISRSIFKEPQQTSSVNQDEPSESLTKKRNLSSSPCCAEKPSFAEKTCELKLVQKSPLRKRKKTKKKKKSSIIKRLFQKLK